MNLPSCTAGCEGRTEGSLGRAVVIVMDWNRLRPAAPRIAKLVRPRHAKVESSV